jgi:hypothetical protein
VHQTSPAIDRAPTCAAYVSLLWNVTSFSSRRRSHTLTVSSLLALAKKAPPLSHRQAVDCSTVLVEVRGEHAARPPRRARDVCVGVVPRRAGGQVDDTGGHGRGDGICDTVGGGRAVGAWAACVCRG